MAAELGRCEVRDKQRILSDRVGRSGSKFILPQAPASARLQPIGDQANRALPLAQIRLVLEIGANYLREVRQAFHNSPLSRRRISWSASLIMRSLNARLSTCCNVSSGQVG